jgi:Cysteine-rich secretory protein family
MSKLAARLAKLAALAALSVSAAAPAATSNLFAVQFPGRVLAAHNAARAQAGVTPLAWDPALGNSAAAYARQLAITNIFQHSDRRARRGVGENLWMGTRGAFGIERMVSDWASERRMFRAGVFPAVARTGNWSDVGHYSQIIWPTTTRVGCALASNARADYLVCHYAPAGNIDGRRVP